MFSPAIKTPIPACASATLSHENRIIKPGSQALSTAAKASNDATINRCNRTPIIPSSLEASREINRSVSFSVMRLSRPRGAWRMPGSPITLQHARMGLCDRSHIRKSSAGGRRFQLAGMNPAGLTFVNDNGLLRSSQPCPKK